MRPFARILGLVVLALAAIVSPAQAQITTLPEVDAQDDAVILKLAELSAQLAGHEARLKALETRQSPPTAATDVRPQAAAKLVSEPAAASGQRYRYTAQMTWPGSNLPDRFQRLRAHLVSEWHRSAANVAAMSDAECVMEHDRLHGKDVARSIAYLNGAACPNCGSSSCACPQGQCPAGCPGGNCSIGQPSVDLAVYQGNWSAVDLQYPEPVRQCAGGNCATGNCAGGSCGYPQKRGRFGIVW